MRSRQKRAQQQRKVNQVRNGIIGLAVAVVVIVLGYGLIYSTGSSSGGEIVAGEHYRVVDNPERRRPGAPIVVTEFFSYGCIHCFNFEPLLEDWLRDLPEDVRFERSPAGFNPMWAMLARAYLALERAGGLEANHERFFRAIHDNGRQFRNVEEIADFVAGRGVERQAFLDAYNSLEVRRRQAEEDARQRRLAIASTPTVVVAGRYAVSMDAGRRQALRTIDHLIELERSAGDT